MAIFKKKLQKKFDQNIHQYAPNCTYNYSIEQFMLTSICNSPCYIYVKLETWW